MANVAVLFKGGRFQHRKAHVNTASNCMTDREEHQERVLFGDNVRTTPRMTCPIESCSREMTRDTGRSDGGHDPLSGLHHVYCLTCRHMGMVPSGDVQVLFCAAHQYVVAYGPSLSTITVVLTPRALAAYQAYVLCFDDLAKLVAGWALLSGIRSGTVTLVPERQECLDFERYLRGHMLQRSSLRVA